MCMNATVNKRNIWTGRKKKPLEEAKSLGGIGVAKDIADSKEVKKGYGGLAGRLIK